MKVYVGDTGTAVVLDTEIDLSSASSVAIVAKRPDGSSVTWIGTVFELTKVRFVTLVDSFNQAGEWRLQARVVLPSGTWLGETSRLTVYRPFA